MFPRIPKKAAPGSGNLSAFTPFIFSKSYSFYTFVLESTVLNSNPCNTKLSGFNVFFIVTLTEKN